jgi:iron complex transport system substrate-binding protein
MLRGGGLIALRCLVLLVFACALPELGAADPPELEVRYADHLTLDSYPGYTVARVSRTWLGGDAEALIYACIDPAADASVARVKERIRRRFPAIPPDAIFTPPIKRMVTLSSTYIPSLLRLEVEDALVAVDKAEHIYSERVRRMIESGKIAEVGAAGSLDIERLLALEPDAVMATGGSGEWSVAPGLEKAAVPLIVNADYLESSPLGRAEWIKFTALLFGKPEEGREQFRRIEERYTQLERRAQKAASRPRVLLNRPMQGRWVLPGGDGYMAQLLEDAGAHYLWEERGGTESMVLDPEAVFARAGRAEFWLHQYGWDSLKEIARAEPYLTQLPAFKQHRVLNNDRRVTAAGANDFYESGALRPDLVLADLIAIFHPNMLPEHELRYYRYLE